METGPPGGDPGNLSLSVSLAWREALMAKLAQQRIAAHIVPPLEGDDGSEVKDTTSSPKGGGAVSWDDAIGGAGWDYKQLARVMRQDMERASDRG